MTASDFDYLQYPDGRVWAVPLEISRQRSFRPETTRQKAVAPSGAALSAPPAARIEPDAPPTFAARLKSILALPEATGKQRRAVDLAASCMMGAKAAAVILAVLPSDADGDQDATVPDADMPLEPDAPRVLGILRAPEAALRPKQATALALDSDMSVDAAVALLARLPEEPKAERILTIAERAAASGPGFEWSSEEPSRKSARDSWTAAMEKAGVTAKSPSTGKERS